MYYNGRRGTDIKKKNNEVKTGISWKRRERKLTSVEDKINKVCGYFIEGKNKKTPWWKFSQLLKNTIFPY